MVSHMTSSYKRPIWFIDNLIDSCALVSSVSPEFGEREGNRASWQMNHTNWVMYPGCVLECRDSDLGRTKFERVRQFGHVSYEYWLISPLKISLGPPNSERRGPKDPHFWNPGYISANKEIIQLECTDICSRALEGSSWSSHYIQNM